MLEVVLAVAVFAVAAAVVRQAAADACYDLSDGERHPHKWGYTDTRFEFDGPKTVRVTGSRYPLAGFTMPHFIPFVEEMLQVPIDPNEMAVEKEAHVVPPSRAGVQPRRRLAGRARRRAGVARRRGAPDPQPRPAQCR